MISSSAASTHSRHYEPHAPHVHAARGQRSSSCVDNWTWTYTEYSIEMQTYA
jgi:hypothetical protein